MDALLLLVVSAGLGSLLRVTGILRPEDGRTLDAWVLRIALPALVLRVVPTLRPTADLLLAAAAPWVAAVAAIALVPPVARALGADRRAEGALVLTAMLGNTAFVGLAVVDALAGADAMAVAVVADQLGSFLALSTLGLITAARYGGGVVSPAALAGRLMRFPPFLALGVALVAGATGLDWPGAVDALLHRLGDTLVPVALFTVGLRFRVAALRGRGALLAAGLAQRLVVGPAFVLGIAWLAGVGDPVRLVAVLQAGMAPMVTAGILAADHDLDADLAAAMVGIGLLASAPTLLAWHALLTGPG